MSPQPRASPSRQWGLSQHFVCPSGTAAAPLSSELSPQNELLCGFPSRPCGQHSPHVPHSPWRGSGVTFLLFLPVQGSLPGMMSIVLCTTSSSSVLGQV